jgi:hypothetical protein
MPKILKFVFFFLISPALTLGADYYSEIEVHTTESKATTVFKWTKDRCFDENIPDSPARAFRSHDGQINLYATHFKNVPMIGPTLRDVRPACNNFFEAPMSSNAQSYDARIWLQSFYTNDGGKTIYSLASSDYHGRWFNNCGNKDKYPLGCWWSAIILAHSNDGGKTFTTTPPPRHIIARAPEEYTDHADGPVGFLTTSNIVKIDSYYYSLFNVAAYGRQPKGNCIARTDDLADAVSWRVWDGAGYVARFANLQNETTTKIPPCKLIASMPYKVRSLLWHEQSRNYIAVFEEFRNIKAAIPRVDARFSYSSSPDLLNWKEPKEILTIKGKDNCVPQSPAAYPSILDDNSEDINFGTVGGEAFLYYTKFNLSDDCKLTLDRDLVRVPIKILTKK